MIFMDSTTYGESVISIPILERGEPTGPMLKGMTYMVRPFMQPGNLSLIAACMSFSAIQLPSIPGVAFSVTGTVCSFESVEMNVFPSTLATSAGLVLASQQFSYFGRGMMVPFFSMMPWSNLLSPSVPSQMCTLSGWQSSTHFSTYCLTAGVRILASPY